MRNTWILFLLGALACSSDPARPRYEILPDMIDAVPYESFSSNPITRDRKTMLLPPSGSVPREGGPVPYGKGPDEAARAGRELENPLERTGAVVARGEKVFGTFCYECHGRTGAGDGPVVPPFPTPPSLVAQHAKDVPDGRIFHVITRGQGLMPSHAAQVQERDRWALVHFVRSLQHASAKGAP